MIRPRRARLTPPRGEQTPLEKLHATARRRSKYGAVRCEVDGEKFDSKREMRRWLELKQLEKAGKIYGLKRHNLFPLWAHSDEGPEPIGKYIDDFGYYTDAECSPESLVVEDCKGFRTALYLWKRRHMKAQYGITILET